MGGRELSLLVARPDRLCACHWPTAIRFAREFGRASADYLGRRIVQAVGRGRLPLSCAFGYLEMVLAPACAEGWIAAADLDRWHQGFRTGRAERDPRVQAFAAAQAERTAEIATAVMARRAVLARFLEVPVARVAAREIAGRGIPVFEAEGLRHVVTDGEESDGLSPDRLARLCGCVDGALVESVPFMGVIIHRARA